MKFRQILNVSHAVFLLFLFAHPVWSQDSLGTTKQNKPRSTWLIQHLSDQDVILPISSIEWGIPDRWSITTRYTHMFEKDRDGKPWLNNLIITLSPGISGGRFAIGYQAIVSPFSMPHMSILSEVRVALLRTWGNPLSISSDRTFAGVEIRSSFEGFINLGIGYFFQISDSNGSEEQFLGFHIGLGI